MTTPSLLAVALDAYLPVLVIFVMASIFAVFNIVASHLIGPRKEAVVKGMPYESGMNPIGGARKRTRTRSRSPRVSRFRTPPPPPPRRPSP